MINHRRCRPGRLGLQRQPMGSACGRSQRPTLCSVVPTSSMLSTLRSPHPRGCWFRLHALYRAYPIADIVELARRRGIVTLVDAAHSPTRGCRHHTLNPISGSATFTRLCAWLRSTLRQRGLPRDHPSRRHLVRIRWWAAKDQWVGILDPALVLCPARHRAQAQGVRHSARRITAWSSVGGMLADAIDVDLPILTIALYGAGQHLASVQQRRR